MGLAVDQMALEVECRTVAWQMSIPRSASKSSTLRKLKGKRTYIITISRMMSGEELKKQSGLAGLQGRGTGAPLPSLPYYPVHLL